MRLRTKVAAIASTTTVVLAMTATSAGAATTTPSDSGPHRSGNVIIDVYSLGGSGPDITRAIVEDANGAPLPLYSVVYLKYGTNPTTAKSFNLMVGVIEAGGEKGYNFAVYRTLTPGRVLCGEINTTSGYPCITIGA